MQIAVSELVFDKNIYPRSKPDSHNIALMADAMRAGQKFPPVTVEKKTKRIIDGVHRWKAWTQVYGKDSKIECELVNESDEGKLLVMCVDLNATHGLQLAAFERTDVLIRMDNLGVTREVALQALRMTAEKAERIEATRTAFRDLPGGGQEKVALKGSMTAFHGETLTKKQQEINAKQSGMKTQFHANQLADLIEAGIVARATESVLAALVRLRDLLNEKLVTKKKK